jgi:tripartite-type tricarboxylate transporter receptor subunit TctC
MRRLRACVGVLIATLTSAAVLCGPAAADPTYPSRTVQIVVPYPAGGLTDILTRAVAERLSKLWSQPVVAVNRGGANGTIATASVAKAEPDGYTILFGTDATLAANMSLYPSVPYDPLRDFIPVSLLGSYQMVLVVNDDIPAKTFPEFIDYLRKQPKPLNYASVGIGSAHHLSMELLKSLAGIDAVHVPYRGGAPATTAIIAREVPMMFNGPATMKAHIETGRARALAVSGLNRSPVFPDVPTIAESGYPTFNMVNWYGLLVPAGTPQPIVDKLLKDIVAVTSKDEFKEWMATQGIEPLSGGPAEFRARIVSETERLAKIVKASGAKLQ